MKQLFSVLLLTFALQSARAAVLLSEPFSYATGSLVTNSAGVWNTHDGTAGQTTVSDGKVMLKSSDSEDVNSLLAGQPYPSAGSTNVFYAGLTVRFQTAPTTSGSYFAHFNASTFRARIFALGGGAPGGQFRLGLSSTSATINQTNLTDLNLNTDYRVIVRLTNTTGVATLWINPSAETDPAITTTEPSSSATITGFALRQTTGIGTFTVDDLGVATTFAEALATNQLGGEAPAILSLSGPETALPGEPAEFTASVSGANPRTHQWHRNGSPIPNATNSTLLLTNLSTADSGAYSLAVTNAFGGTNSSPLPLTVLPLRTPHFSLLNFNLHGNSDPNWTTNNSQVRSIGRILTHLDPDIMTFQEIPTTNNGLANMVGIMQAYRPGFFIATNSGTDTFIHMVIVSRWPINRSQSWLDGADLDPFGYTNANFARDLFEAEIAVPDFSQPLHVFTAHLKSGSNSSDDSARRAAEASAISNFLTTVFLPTKGHRPYVLTGDLNEDIAVPSTGSQQPIQRLVNPATGLRLTTPVNPITDGTRTFSIQDTINGLTKRYDYIMPGGLLYSNFAGAQIFRSDVLSPLPPNLFSNDSRFASDHLAVLMKFGNPFEAPFRLLSLDLTNSSMTLRWESSSNRLYAVEQSDNLTAWTTLATNITATNTNTSFTTNAPAPAAYYRVYRIP